MRSRGKVFEDDFLLDIYACFKEGMYRMHCGLDSEVGILRRAYSFNTNELKTNAR